MAVFIRLKGRLSHSAMPLRRDSCFLFSKKVSEFEWFFLLPPFKAENSLQPYRSSENFGLERERGQFDNRLLNWKSKWSWEPSYKHFSRLQRKIANFAIALSRASYKRMQLFDVIVIESRSDISFGVFCCFPTYSSLLICFRYLF